MRKIIDINPIITIRAEYGFPNQTMEAAETEAKRIIREISDALIAGFEFKTTYETDARCSHCNASWISETSDYNDGCCDADEANAPSRLADLHLQAEAIQAEDFYALHDDGRRSRGPASWAENLAIAALAWLDQGRPFDRAEQLKPLIKRVNEIDWCTVWSDPGPDGCSLARLPDSITPDSRPNDFANELLSLLDDMSASLARAA